jgi:hypothetical protein
MTRGWGALDTRRTLGVANPAPNLRIGAHAAGIGEAKGAQSPGTSSTPFVVASGGA